MLLKPLAINKNYFQDLPVKSNFIKAINFDKQFTTITNYLNKSVLKVLNQLVSTQVPGSTNPAHVGKNLINIGDTTVNWETPKVEYIYEYSLSLAKLMQANPNSILATNNEGIASAISPSVHSLALTSRKNNTPIWQKITGKSIIDNAITKEKIALGSLNLKNFGIELARKNITVNTKAIKIKPGTVNPNSAIRPRSLTQKNVSLNFWGDEKFPALIIVHPYLKLTPDWIKNVNDYDRNYNNKQFFTDEKLPSWVYATDAGYEAFDRTNLYMAIDGAHIKRYTINCKKLFRDTKTSFLGSKIPPESITLQHFAAGVLN